MKQLFQNLRSGQLTLEDIPAPSTSPNHLLIQTRCSLISPGTERMLLEFGKAGYLAKARQQPDKLKQLFEKARNDGIRAAMRAALARLDQPLPLGYCNAGTVLETGSSTEGFEPGDRIVSNSPHAEVVRAPKLLCAKIPDAVSDEESSFTVLASVALQGIRLLKPELGETIAVFGLGAVGLLAVQLLKASGVRVIGFDLNSERVALASSFGATAYLSGEDFDAIAAAKDLTGGTGVDGVLLCAATKGDELIHTAAQMCRKRGRIILTGVTGLNLRRADFYDKELSFQVSCAYGPGRYDPAYEKEGRDYPLAYARWTVQRNFESVLELMREGRLDVKPLISKRIPFAQALSAYESLSDASALGIILTYEQQPAEEILSRAPVEHFAPSAAAGAAPAVAVIGPGSFAQLELIPAIKKSGARLKWSASASGQSAALSAKRFGFEKSTSKIGDVLLDPEVQSVFIATRHDSHARLVIEALRHGKHVYVEKPLCLNEDELEEIETVYESSSKDGKGPLLMVGFNRRFSRFTAQAMKLIANRTEPLAITYTCNAGFVSPEHWVHDEKNGGGRIIGEVCHFVDLVTFLTGSKVVSVSAAAQRKGPHAALGDVLSASMEFEDGSIAALNYFANGHRSIPKERIEIFGGGKIMQLENFRRLSGAGFSGFKSVSSWKQDKGHEAAIAAFTAATRDGASSPIPFDQIVHSMHATFAVAESATTGRRVVVA